MTDITGYVNLALLIALIAYLVSVRRIMVRVAAALEKIASTPPDGGTGHVDQQADPGRARDGEAPTSSHRPSSASGP